MSEAQVINLNFIKGMNTKTEEVFVQDEFIILENCEMKNEKIVKSTGYVKIGGEVSITDSTEQQVFVYNENLYKIQEDELYAYRPLTNSFNSKADVRVLSVNSLTAQSNLDSLANRPIISALYGNYFCYGFLNTATGYWEIKILNYETQQVLYSDSEFLLMELSGAFTAILDIVGTPNGLFIYYTDDYTVDPANINETRISFSDFSIDTTLNVVEDLYPFLPAISASYPSYVTWSYPMLSCKYNNGQVFVLYRTGTITSCVGKLLIRSLSGGAAFSEDTFADAMDLTGVQGNLNIGLFSLSDDSIPYVVAMFGYKFYPMDVSTYGKFSVLSPFAYTTPGDEIFQTFNIGYLPDSTELVMLKHNPVQTLTTGTQVCPFINKYDVANATWTEYTNTCDSRYNDGEYFNVYGACSLAGGLICLNGKSFFAVALFPYLYIESGGSPVSQTPQNERVCTVYLVDSDYNVVQSLVSYNGYLDFIATSGSYGLSYVMSTPRLKINAHINTDVNTVYPFWYDQTIETNSTSVTVTTSIVLRNVSSVLPTDFFYADYDNQGYFGNGRLIEIANETISEQGFFDYPRVNVIVSASSGSLTSSAKYGYKTIYKWNNGSGSVVRSAPSIAKLITLGGSDTAVDIYFVPYPFFTQKSGVKIEHYRTLPNGAVYYKCGESTDVTDRTFTDTMSDADLQEQNQLYTNGGALPAFPFEPSTAGWTIHDNRIFSAVNNYVYYSKEFKEGVAVEANPRLYIVGDTKGGDWTGIASLDSNLILFKKDYIYACSGSGANNLGQNSTLSNPFNINSPVGCISANSIVRTPLGIVFQSYKGIYLLSRSLEVSYLGAPVEAFNDYTITTGTLLLRENKIKFATLEGYILTYDYFYNVWSYEYDLKFVYTTIYDGGFTGILLDGNVYKNDTSIYTRDGEYYSMKIKTPWLKAAGLQGCMSIKNVQFLGKYLAPHNLNLSIAFDYSPIPVDFQVFLPTDKLGSVNSYGVGSWGNTTLFGGLFNSVYQFQMDPLKSLCMSVQFTIEDSFNSTTYEDGSSCELFSLVLEYIPKNIVYKILPSQRAISSVG